MMGKNAENESEDLPRDLGEYNGIVWRPHKNADGQAGQEVAAWTAAQGAPTVLSQEGVGQAVAEVYQVWRSKTHTVSWNAHAVDALPVGTKLYASPACSAPDEALEMAVAHDAYKSWGRWRMEELSFKFAIRWAIREYIRRAGKNG